MTLINATQAGRIKQARGIIGKNRQDFERELKISHHTFQYWETGKFPLSSKGAKRLSKAFLEFGLLCSEEWLLHGTGQAPMVMPRNQHPENFVKSIDSEIAILREIEVFNAINTDPIVVMVADDGMQPKFDYGEYVGGNKRRGKEIKMLIGTDCIVETVQGHTFLRRLMATERIESYTLACLNPNTKESPVLPNIALSYAAQVVWHRKKEEIKE